MKVDYEIKKAQLSNDKMSRLRCFVSGIHNGDGFNCKFTIDVNFDEPGKNPDESNLLRFIMGYMDDMCCTIQHDDAIASAIKEFE